MRDFLALTFTARGNGFQFAAPPPPDIADARYLKSSDPDDALGCALANLRQGRFEMASVLINGIASRSDPGWFPDCTKLIGYAAPTAEVRRFVAEQAPQTTGLHRYYVCAAGVAAGGLWVVPALIDTYLAATRSEERRYVSHALSWLLEEEPGAIDEGPLPIATEADDDLSFGEEPEPQFDTDGWIAKVQTRLHELRQEHGTDDRRVIVEGRLFDVGVLARKLLSHIHGNPYADRDRVDKGKLLLEATTGWDCRGFYNEAGGFQPLRAAAVVEAFLDSGEAARYEPGVRYFFGHRIPQ